MTVLPLFSILGTRHAGTTHPYIISLTRCRCKNCRKEVTHTSLVLALYEKSFLPNHKTTACFTFTSCLSNNPSRTLCVSSAPLQGLHPFSLVNSTQEQQCLLKSPLPTTSLLSPRTRTVRSRAPSLLRCRARLARSRYVRASPHSHHPY